MRVDGAEGVLYVVPGGELSGGRMLRAGDGVGGDR